MKLIIQVYLDYISRGDEYIDATWWELWYFFRDIVELVDQWNKEAINFLRILMDKQFIYNITHKQFSTLHFILRVYKERKATWRSNIDNLHEEFLTTIIQISLNSNDSFITREIKGDLFGWINQGKGLLSLLIFESFSFIARYNLFSDKRFVGSYKSKIEKDLIYTANYASFFEHAIKSFFADITNNIRYYETVYNGILVFCSYPRSLAKLRIEEKKFISPFHWIHNGIYDNSDQILRYFDNNIPFFSLEEYTVRHHLEPKNIFDSLAFGFCELCESISHIEETSENSSNIRDMLSLIENDFLDFWSSNNNQRSEGSIFRAIALRINKIFEKKVLEDNLYGRYPMLTRIFFHLWGYQIFNGDEAAYDKDFCLNILQWFANKLPELYEWKIWSHETGCLNSNEDIHVNRLNKAHEIIDDLLPKNMYYDYERKVLGYFFGYDRTEKTELDLMDVLQWKVNIKKFA